VTSTMSTQVPRGSSILSAEQYFGQLVTAVRHLPFNVIEQVCDVLMAAYERESTVFLFGNGGSAALASHFACDLGKGTAGCDGGKRFRAMALTDNLAVITAWANDADYSSIFAEQLAHFVKPQDVVIAISGSGASRNVLEAVSLARDAGAITIGITGFGGGKLAPMCDVAIIVPSDNMQIIEDLHLSAAHAIFTLLRHRIVHKTHTVVVVADKTMAAREGRS